MDPAHLAPPDTRRRIVKLGSIAACAALILLLLVARMAWVPTEGGDSKSTGAGPTTTATGAVELGGAPETAVRTVVPIQDDSKTAAPSAPVASADTEAIEGVLRVFDDEDRLHEEEDGSFLLTADDESEGRTIDVRSGRWRTEIRPHVEYRTEDVLAGGRPAAPVMDRQPRRRADGKGWEVLAHWTRSTVLVVRGVDTGLDLSEVDVAANVPNGGREGCHPGVVDEKNWIVRGARSPIRIPPESEDHWAAGTRELYVHARGYAWGCVRVPESLGGEYLVALAPGGTLDVLVSGLDASQADAVLRLRSAARADADPMFEQRIGASSFAHIEGLEPGRWVATVELGHQYRWPQVLARGEVSLSAGGLAHLELAVDALPVPELAPFSGRVVTSPDWKFDEIQLSLELLHEAPRGRASAHRSITARRSSEPTTEAREVWEWSVEGGVMPGRWSVDFFRLGLGLAVDVPAQGRDDVVLEIPEPVVVQVQTLDDDSGRPVTDARLTWMPPRGWSEVSGQLLETDALGEGRFTFRAPRGRIQLWCFSERHAFRQETIEVLPPRVEHVLRLSSACGFLLRVRDGSNWLAWPMAFGWRHEARRIDGEGQGEIQEQDANLIETRFVVTAPGRYRLDLPSLPGYAPLAPQEILVPPGEFVRHDIVLVRR